MADVHKSLEPQKYSSCQPMTPISLLHSCATRLIILQGTVPYSPVTYMALACSLQRMSCNAYSFEENAKAHMFEYLLIPIIFPLQEPWIYQITDIAQHMQFIDF